MRLSPLLRWRRRSGNRRVNGRQHALSASWFRVPHRHAVAGWPWGGEQDWSAGFMPCWCWPLLAREGSRGGLWPPTRWWQEQGGAAGPEERRTCQVRRSLNVRRACRSRSCWVRLSPLLRWRRRSGNRRVNGRMGANMLSARPVWLVPLFSLVYSDLGNHQFCSTLLSI